MGNLRQAKDIAVMTPLGRKNAIIDGNFDVWLEATTQTSAGYGSDTMWNNSNAGSTKTHARVLFGLGQTEVPGNPKSASQTVVSSVTGAANQVSKTQYIEGVHTLAGETATLSFWAKADANKLLAVDLLQYFGTGGSPSAPVLGIGATKFNLTTAWTKYTLTVQIPAVTGKVLGTSNTDNLRVQFWFDAGTDYNQRTDSLGHQSGTFTIAQVQLESGSVATEFERLTIGETLRLVGRYYSKGPLRTGSFCYFGGNWLIPFIDFPIEMRTIPIVAINATGGTPLGAWTAQAEITGFRSILCYVGTMGDNSFIDGSWTADARL